jgi:hypothetical protein
MEARALAWRIVVRHLLKERKQVSASCLRAFQLLTSSRRAAGAGAAARVTAGFCAKSLNRKRNTVADPLPQR